MAINLWGVVFFWKISPLYDFECLKVGSVPTVTPIDKQVLDEGNCVRVIDRGEEACGCAVKLTPRTCGQWASLRIRRQPHPRQNYEVTNRNRRHWIA